MDIWHLHSNPEHIREFDNRLMLPKLAFRLLSLNLLSKEDTGIAETTISTNSQFSFLYARDKLKGRFFKGEKAIATSETWAILYAQMIIKGRFELGEEVIMKSDFKQVYEEFLSQNKINISFF